MKIGKRELFARWRLFNDSLNASEVLQPVLNKYYFTSSHSPAPVILDNQFLQKAHRFSSLLSKILPYIVEGYFSGDSEITEVLCMDHVVHSLLKRTSQGNIPFSLGSWRPDFLLQLKNPDHPFLVCEINARFALNGYLYSHYLYEAQLQEECSDGTQLFPVRNLTPTILSYFDLSCAIGLLKKREAGYGANILISYMRIYHPTVSFRLIDPVELHMKNGKLTDNVGHVSQFIVELHQDEILALSEEIVTELVTNCRCVNDFRTIFLLHDKRLLSLLCNTSFLERFLPKDDAKFVAACVVPTGVVSLHSEMVSEAIGNPDDFIIKPNLLGKGEGTLIGADCDRSVWREYVTNEKNKYYILQKFIPSQIIAHESVKFISDEQNDEEMATCLQNIVGMLLCHDKDFYGIGFFRLSQDKVCALSRGGNSCLAAWRNGSGTKNALPLTWQQDVLSELNHINDYWNVYLSSFQGDGQLIPLDIVENNQQIAIFAKHLKQAAILSESDITLSLFQQGNLVSDSLCFTQLSEQCKSTVLPTGKFRTDHLALFDRFSINSTYPPCLQVFTHDIAVAGEISDLLQLSEQLDKETRMSIKKIIVGYLPFTECQRKQLNEAYENVQIHSILGSSLLGVWAFQKAGTDHYRSFSDCIVIHGIGEEFDSSTSLVVSKNRVVAPLIRCSLFFMGELSDFTCRNSSYTFRLRNTS